MKAALIIFVVVIIIFAIVIVKTPIKDVLVESIKMFKDISEQNEMYREADIEELMKVKGINENLAKKLKTHFSKILN